MNDLLTGNCLEVMPTLDADSVDSIVTDPPYGLSFMGKDWDKASASSVSRCRPNTWRLRGQELNGRNTRRDFPNE